MLDSKHSFSGKKKKLLAKYARTLMLSSRKYDTVFEKHYLRMMLDGCHNTTELTFLSKVHQNSDVLNPKDLYCTYMKNTADNYDNK